MGISSVAWKPMPGADAKLRPQPRGPIREGEAEREHSPVTVRSGGSQGKRRSQRLLWMATHAMGISSVA